MHSARKPAVHDAPPEDRERADTIREALRPQDRLTTAIDDLMQTRVNWLPRLLLDTSRDDDELRPLLDDSSSAASVCAAWLAQLMDRCRP